MISLNNINYTVRANSPMRAQKAAFGNSPEETLPGSKIATEILESIFCLEGNPTKRRSAMGDIFLSMMNVTGLTARQIASEFRDPDRPPEAISSIIYESIMGLKGNTINKLTAIDTIIEVMNDDPGVTAAQISDAMVDILEKNRDEYLRDFG